MSKQSKPARKFVTFTLPAEVHGRIKAAAAILDITIPKWCENMVCEALERRPR